MTLTHLIVLAAPIASELLLGFAPEKKRAQGRPGAQLAPMARVQQKKHAAGTTGVADHPAFPAQWF